ncbi:hypothetical protein BDZ89DRAFT_1128604 [Hymenopellis radicata]|nr:hypothetical protein BDZ89DRAFT_1128604 [Hymenopellis radicata]
MWSPPLKQPWSQFPQPQPQRNHEQPYPGDVARPRDYSNTIDDQWYRREDYPNTMGGDQWPQQPPQQFVHLRRTLSIPDRVFGHSSPYSIRVTSPIMALTAACSLPRTPSPRRKPEDPIMELAEPQAESSAMVVDEPEPEPRAPSPLPPPRTPTPLPDFHIDEDLLTELRDRLRTSTFSLNVEQLEQLRAMCLGAVWRKRAEWDRDGLLRELQDVVRTFVREVEEEDEEE